MHNEELRRVFSFFLQNLIGKKVLAIRDGDGADQAVERW